MVSDGSVPGTDSTVRQLPVSRSSSSSHVTASSMLPLSRTKVAQPVTTARWPPSGAHATPSVRHWKGSPCGTA